MVLSECHGKEQDLAKVWNTNRFFVGEAPVEGDPASGVAIVLSARVAKAVRPGRADGAHAAAAQRQIGRPAAAQRRAGRAGGRVTGAEGRLTVAPS